MTSGSPQNKQKRAALTQGVMPVVGSLLIALLFVLVFTVAAHANPYLPKPGEKLVKVRIATCAVSGGFAHLYTALDYGIFEKYGIKMEHIFIRGSNAALAALAADEIQFLYCAAEATIPGLCQRSRCQIGGGTAGQTTLRTGNPQRDQTPWRSQKANRWV